jgi:uncharacterized 2Fe-2S/4Fe-4S cluster protein (DUF4445 family)
MMASISFMDDQREIWYVETIKSIGCMRIIGGRRGKSRFAQQGAAKACFSESTPLGISLFCPPEISAGNRKKSMPSLVQLITVDCPKPSLQDNTGDIDRLKKNVMGKCGGSLVVPYGAMVRIAKSCRQADFAGFAVVNDCNSHFELVDFLATKPAILPAVALDLGTTHLEASLLDLFTGDVVAQATIANGQIEYGTDILSRIHFAATAGGLQILQQAVVAGINTLFSS